MTNFLAGAGTLVIGLVGGFVAGIVVTVWCAEECKDVLCDTDDELITGMEFYDGDKLLYVKKKHKEEPTE